MADTLIDSYSEANGSINYAVDSSLSDGTHMGQSFTGNGINITQAIFMMRVSGGTPTGNLYARVYAHTGTFGSTGVPTGSPLATSEPINATTVTSTNTLRTFTFSGASRIKLTNGTKYFIVVDASGVGDASNYITLRADNTSPTHGGNLTSYTGSWNANSGSDVCFYVYGTVLYDTSKNTAQSVALNASNSGLLATVNVQPTEVLPGSTSIAYKIQPDAGAGFTDITKNAETTLTVPALGTTPAHKWQGILTGTIDQTPDLTDLTISFRKAMPANATADWLAQSFSSGTGGSIAALLFNIVKDVSGSVDYTVEIQTDNAGSPSGTVVTNGTATIAAANVPNQAASGTFTWVSATFSTPPALAASTTYWIVLKPASSGTPKLLWRSRGGNSYSDGAAKYSTDSGGSYTAMTNEDFLFQVLLAGGTFSVDVIAKYKRRYL